MNFLNNQPSRAIYIFLKLTKIPFEACPVALRTGEHLTDDFKKRLNKFQTVPFIHDGDFKLAESVGIFRYLSREYPLEDHWYPKDSKQKAKVDEYLEWQHLNIRLYCTMYFRTKMLMPRLTGKPASEDVLTKMRGDMEKTLDKFQDLFLENGPYVTGDKISFADIIAACEIEQPRLAGYEPRDGRPKLNTWIDRVRSDCNPFYDEAHEILNKIVKKSSSKL